MTDYATLTDTVTETSVDFIMATGWKPKIPEIGSIQYELGNSFPIKKTDGTKGIQGSFDLVSTSDDMDHTIETLAASINVLLLTLPNGDSYYIVWNPATPRSGNKPFSSMAAEGIPPLNTWTFDYVQVATP
jgi:hypothetical protein